MEACADCQHARRTHVEVKTTTGTAPFCGWCAKTLIGAEALTTIQGTLPFHAFKEPAS